MQPTVHEAFTGEGECTEVWEYSVRSLTSGHSSKMGRVDDAIAAWESHAGSGGLPSSVLDDDAKWIGALPVTFRLSPENGFDDDVLSKQDGSLDIPRSEDCQRRLRVKASAIAERVSLASSDPSPAIHTHLAADREYEEDERSTSVRSCDTLFVSDCQVGDPNLRESCNYSVPDYKDDIWVDVHGKGLQVSVCRRQPMKAVARLEDSSLSKNGEELETKFSGRCLWDSLGGVADSTDSSECSFERTLGPHLNSSLDRSESEHVDTEDAIDTLDGISKVAGSQSYSSSSLCVDQALGEWGGNFTTSPVYGRMAENSSSRAVLDTKGYPRCAIIGAETFLGSHVLQALLLTRSHHIKALVTSPAIPEHFSLLVSDFLSVVLIGDPSLPASRRALHDALHDAETVVDCSDVDLTDVRTSQVADTILESAKGLVAALDHPSSSVKRLIYCGSDLAVWDPRESSLNSTAIESELDENDWFSIMDDDRKLSHAEAHGRTAAEMYLWTRAAGDRVPYSMCSVISSLVLGPVLSSTHTSTAGPLVRFLARLRLSFVHAMPVVFAFSLFDPY